MSSNCMPVVFEVTWFMEVRRRPLLADIGLNFERADAHD